QKNLDEAISEFNMALRLGKNTQVDGEAYLRLGEIYYDTLKQYAFSSAYYDSAINSLSKDYEGYAAIKERQEILNEFVKNLNIIQQQDSLLKLSALDSASLHQMLDSAFQARKRIAELETKNTKKRSRRVQITIAASDNVFASIGEDGENSFGSQQSAGGAWYFYNPTATAIGQTKFRRIWGDVALEDNWRRSQRSSSGNVRQSRTQESATPDQASPQEEEAPADDPVIAEFNKINSQIPRTPEQKEASLKMIEDAYFKLGDIYYFKLQENENAVTSYNTLLTRFPESPYEPEVLYRLYVMLKD